MRAVEKQGERDFSKNIITECQSEMRYKIILQYIKSDDNNTENESRAKTSAITQHQEEIAKGMHSNKLTNN